MLRTERPPAHIEQASKDIDAIRGRINADRASLATFKREATTQGSRLAATLCLESMDGIERVLNGQPAAQGQTEVPITWESVSAGTITIEDALDGSLTMIQWPSLQ